MYGDEKWNINKIAWKQTLKYAKINGERNISDRRNQYEFWKRQR